MYIFSFCFPTVFYHFRYPYSFYSTYSVFFLPVPLRTHKCTSLSLVSSLYYVFHFSLYSLFIHSSYISLYSCLSHYTTLPLLTFSSSLSPFFLILLPLPLTILCTPPSVHVLLPLSLYSSLLFRSSTVCSQG